MREKASEPDFSDASDDSPYFVLRHGSQKVASIADFFAACCVLIQSFTVGPSIGEPSHQLEADDTA